MSEQRQPVPSTYPEPRVRVYGDIAEKIGTLRADQRLRFYDALWAYAFRGEMPTFTDQELTDLWQQTQVRPCRPGEYGTIRLKKGGRDGE